MLSVRGVSWRVSNLRLKTFSLQLLAARSIRHSEPTFPWSVPRFKPQPAHSFPISIISSAARWPASSTASGIAAALNGIPGHPVNAHDNGDGTVSIEITSSNTQHIGLANTGLSIGNSAIGLDLKTDLSTDIVGTVDIKLIFDTNAGTLALDPTNTKELNLHIGTDLGISGNGNLGPLGIHIEDKGTAPEFNLDFGVDIKKLDITASNALELKNSGSVDLNLGMNTVIDPKLLPNIFADLNFHWAYNNDDGPASPTFNFNHVQISLGELVSNLINTLKPITDFIFKTTPIGDVLKAITGPVPIVDDAPAILKSFLNQIGSDNPATISFLDIAALYYKSQGNDQAVDQLKAFSTAVELLKQIQKITSNNGIPNDARIDLADFSFSGSTPPDPATLINDAITSIQDALGNNPVFNKAISAIEGLASGNEPSILDGLTDPSHKEGLFLPLLDHPEQIIRVLLPGLYPNDPPPSLVEFHLPKLTFEAGFDQFIRILGPLRRSHLRVGRRRTAVRRRVRPELRCPEQG